MEVPWEKTDWKPQQDRWKAVSVVLPLTLVEWASRKSWAFVLELTTHTWPRRQRLREPGGR